MDKFTETQQIRNEKMIKNILANDNAEDYYSDSRSDNYFEEQDSVRDDDD